MRRRRPPPIPRVVGLRARRRGDAVRVSWRTDQPAYRVQFLVEGRRERRGESNAGTDVVEAGGRRRFAVQLSARGVRFVVLRLFLTERNRIGPVRVVRVR